MRRAAVVSYLVRWLATQIVVPADGRIRIPIDPSRTYDVYVVATDSVGLQER